MFVLCNKDSSLLNLDNVEAVILEKENKGFKIMALTNSANCFDIAYAYTEAKAREIIQKINSAIRAGMISVTI